MWAMSTRIRTRTDGTIYTQVRYRIDGRAGSLSFNDHGEALKFDALITKVGARKALEISKIVISQDRRITVGEWLKHHNDHLTGVDAGTLKKYRSYADNDFDALADIPLVALTADDVAAWVNGLRLRNGNPASGKTVGNKHGYLAGALNVAVQRGHLKANPCDHVDLPSWDRAEMCFLEPDEYQIVRAAVTEYWRPLVDFLVVSGARWSEATALRPADVNRASGTVRIFKSWKQAEGGGLELGPPKTKKSKRTINIDAAVLNRLTYTGEFLFTNSGRGRHNPDGVVRIQSFTKNVWHPAIARAAKNGLTKTPRVHDLRHTCASWLIQAGRPLPAVQEQLGHESILTTINSYFHLNRDSGKDNAGVLGRLITDLDEN
jgi:integrase